MGAEGQFCQRRLRTLQIHVRFITEATRAAPAPLGCWSQAPPPVPGTGLKTGVLNVQFARRRLLAAGVSRFAIGAGRASPAAAATTQGVRQEDSGTIAINLYEVDAEDGAVEFTNTAHDSKAGGAAYAEAQILCARFATCADPGALEQFAKGVATASNGMVIGGAQAIRATADATGEAATAIAFIDAALSQHAESGGKARDSLSVSGTLGVTASAVAHASDGDAFAQAIVSQAIAIDAIGKTEATIELD